MNNKQNRTFKRWFTVVATIVTLLVVFLVVRTQGYVSGREFSPTHFQQRDFSFYEIPLLHIQITPIKRSSATPATAIYVRQNGLITTPAGTPKYWHIVSLSRGLTGTTPADAGLLMDQMELGSSGDEYWRTWSKDHPQHAKILWPLIQKLSIRELYLLMPPLFELTQVEQTPQELQAKLDERLQRDYVQLVQDMRDADRNDLAETLLSEAIGDYPTNDDLQALKQPASPATN